MDISSSLRNLAQQTALWKSVGGDAATDSATQSRVDEAENAALSGAAGTTIGSSSASAESGADNMELLAATSTNPSVRERALRLALKLRGFVQSKARQQLDSLTDKFSQLGDKVGAQLDRWGSALDEKKEAATARSSANTGRFTFRDYHRDVFEGPSAGGPYDLSPALAGGALNSARGTIRQSQVKP